MARAARNSLTPTARGPWPWAWGGALLGLCAALVLFAPAHWLARAIDAASAGRVQLADARGTVWTGSARLVLSGGAGSRDAAALAERLEWRIRPARDGLHAALRARCCMSQAWQLTVQPRWNGLRIAGSDVLSHWPAALLAGLGTPWNTLQPQGQLALSTQGLSAEWNAGRMSLNGRVQLDAAEMSSRLSTLRPIGSYRILLQGGDTPTMQLETLAGSSLQLSGSGRWVGARLHFEGTASAAPERVDALSNLLNIIGRRDGARSLIKIG